MKTGKAISILVMILSGISIIIVGMQGYLTTQEWGAAIISFGLFATSLRNYLKDHYGVL